MAQINKPSDYFNTVLYTGNGSTQSITGVGFQPDLVWQKSRSVTYSNTLSDIVRGTGKEMYTNSTNAEVTGSNLLTSFDSDGFSIGNDNGWNSNNDTKVAWNWLADGTASSNTDGSITSSVSANTTAGFSIATYTGTGANATVGHGLGSAPKIIFVKCRSNADNWVVYNGNSGGTKYLLLNATNAEATQSNIWNDTDATSSVFSLGTSSAVNGSTRTYVAYCFAEKKGYSKFGSYEGNGSTDGVFVYTGFKPAWVLIKRTSATENWVLWDNKRDPFNNFYHVLFPNATSVEDTSNTGSGGRYIGDFLSNGFKLRNTHSTSNHGGSDYIYMAFAENPLVGTNNIPATAR